MSKGVSGRLQAPCRGDVSFERRDAEEHLIADFDLEHYEIHQYKKVLPKRMRPEMSGTTIIIKNPDDFIDWVDVAPLGAGSTSLVQRLLPLRG